MTAVVWRLHRHQVYFAAAALAVLTAVLLITGIVMAGDYHSFLANCVPTHTCSDGRRLYDGDGMIIDLVYASMIVPLLFGLFWGGPLLAREFEEGTHNLAWTQGVSRRRWLVQTVGWCLLAAAVWGAALAALVTWWRNPENALEMPVRLSTGAFDIQGVVPVAYSVFAVALGIAAGCVFRRVLPALATTLGTFVALRVLVAEYLRPHFLPAIRKLLPFGLSTGSGGRSLQIGPGFQPPAGSWVLSNVIISANGQRLTQGDLRSVLPVPARCTSPGSTGCQGWHLLISYQPGTRFWAFQGIETGIFIALAAGLVTVAYLMVMRRDA